MHIINTKHFEIDILYRPKVLSAGIDFGNNKTIKGKWSNVFLEIGILFWTFGFEIKWSGE